MKRFVLLSIILLFFVFPKSVFAVCPVCTVAVAGGLGISRWLGIDDSVTGIWIGGIILSSGFWLSDWIRKKDWKVPYPDVLSIGLFFLLVIPPLYWADMIGSEGNVLWGFDKIIFGTTLGSLIFLGSVNADKWLRTVNEDKVFVYYQKVIIPVFSLTLGSYVLYLITR